MIWHERQHSSFGVALSVAVAALVGGASAAWACTPQLQASVSRDSGQAGTEVRVDGSFTREVSVVVYWNESGNRDSEMGRAKGGTFSIATRIPQVEPGWNYIHLIASDDGGPVGSKSFAFRVIGERKETSPATPPPEGEEANQRPVTGPPENAPPSHAPAASTAAAAEPGETSPGESGTSPTSEAATGAPTPARGGRTDGRPATRRASEAPPAPQPAGDLPAEQAVPLQVTAKTAELEASAFPAATVSSDLWSGFAAEAAPRLDARVEDPTRPSPNLAAAWVLISVGLLGLVAAVAVPLRKARVRATGH